MSFLTSLKQMFAAKKHDHADHGDDCCAHDAPSDKHEHQGDCCKVDGAKSHDCDCGHEHGKAE